MSVDESDEATEQRSEEGVVFRAALALWEPLARFAWRETQGRGRGVVLVDRDDLLLTADDQTRVLPMSFVPATIIPPGDDFATLIDRYDPIRQVAVLVGGAGDDQLLILEPSDDTRPKPPDC